MLHNHNLAKSISDVAWNMLVKSTQNKAAYAGSKVMLVDPRNTSQICSGCGLMVKKDLSERVHNCSGCGLVYEQGSQCSYKHPEIGDTISSEGKQSFLIR